MIAPELEMMVGLAKGSSAYTSKSLRLNFKALF